MRGICRSFLVIVTVLASVVAGAMLSAASAAYRTTADSSWVPNGAVYAIARDGNRIYLGGRFTRLLDPATGRSVVRNRVAALNANTGALIEHWNPGANGTVEAIAVDRNRNVYLGGAFTSAGGRTANRIAGITRAGGWLPGFSASANGTVYDVVANGASLYVAGTFGTINGTQRPRLARIRTANGQPFTNFDARVAGGRVRTLTLHPDGRSLVIGGMFTTVGGTPRGFLAAVALGNGAVTGWAPERICDRCYVYDVATGDGRAYVAVAGPGGRVGAFPLTANRAAWTRWGDGDLQAIDFEDGIVYAGGHFGPTFAGNTRHQLVAMAARNGTVQGYAVAFTGRDHPGIWDILADQTGLRIGGGFQLAGGPGARYAKFPVL
jgi:hypothetical protein